MQTNIRRSKRNRQPASEAEQQRHQSESPIAREPTPDSDEPQRLSTSSRRLQEPPNGKRAQLFSSQGRAHLSGSSAAQPSESAIPRYQPAYAPASNSHTTTPRGWVISDFPSLDSICSTIGRKKRDGRGYASILDPNLRLLTQATAVWAEKTILFDDAFPPGDESIAFWDYGCWAKAQQQLELSDPCTKKCRRVVRVQSSGSVVRLTAM